MRVPRTVAAAMSCVGIGIVGLALGPAGAGAATTFGGDPNQPINTELGCATGAPIISLFFEPMVYPGTEGSPSCMWTWSSPSAGSDIVPIPATGGSGTITSVTLPAMPKPGTMRVVVLTAALSQTTEPGKPTYVCCQIKQVGPDFTVPPNQVTNVPQSLHVSATQGSNPNL